MFEQLEARVRIRAEQRARDAAERLRDHMADELPRGVRAETGEGGVLISGRGLVRRWLLDPALRWLVLGAVR